MWMRTTILIPSETREFCIPPQTYWLLFCILIISPRWFIFKLKFASSNTQVCGMVDPGLVTESPNLVEEIYTKLIKTSPEAPKRAYFNKCLWTAGVYENRLMTLVKHVSWHTERLSGESAEGNGEQVYFWDSQAWRSKVMLEGSHTNEEMPRICAGIRRRDQGPPNCSSVLPKLLLKVSMNKKTLFDIFCLRT